MKFSHEQKQYLKNNLKLLNNPYLNEWIESLEEEKNNGSNKRNRYTTFYGLFN